MKNVLGFPIAAVVGMGSKINNNIKDLNSFRYLDDYPF